MQRSLTRAESYELRRRARHAAECAYAALRFSGELLEHLDRGVPLSQRDIARLKAGWFRLSRWESWLGRVIERDTVPRVPAPTGGRARSSPRLTGS